jgi:hypothetical protein
MWLLVALAVVASLAACGSGNRAPTTTRSAGLKTEVFRISHPSLPAVYLQFRGPPRLVSSGARFFRTRVTAGGGRLIVVPKTHGPKACGFHVHNVTIRVYGGKSFASSLCKGVRKGLASAKSGG